MKLQRVYQSFFSFCVQMNQINSPDDSSASYFYGHHSQRKAKMYASMKMMPTLPSQSMCEKLQVKEGVESLLGAFYNLQLRWIKNRPLTLNYNLVFNLLLLIKGSRSFIPKANTCSKTMFLPRGSHSRSLPAEKELFEVYDIAFTNTFFGLS